MATKSPRVRVSLPSLLAVIAMLGAYLAVAPSAIADPAPGPGAVSQATAGDLASGTIPMGRAVRR